MARFHLIFGVVVFIAFLISGRFMRMDFPDKDAISPEFRLLMRSRHIYILLSGLIHILLGLYFRPQKEVLLKTLQMIGSFLLILASILLVWAFVYESYALHHFSQISRYGLYLILAGTVFHLLGNYSRNQQNSENES